MEHIYKLISSFVSSTSPLSESGDKLLPPNNQREKEGFRTEEAPVSFRVQEVELLQALRT